MVGNGIISKFGKAIFTLPATQPPPPRGPQVLPGLAPGALWECKNSPAPAGPPPGDLVVFDLTLCPLLPPQTKASQSVSPVLSQAPSCRMKRGCRPAPKETISPPSSGRTVRSQAAPLPFPQLASSREHPRGGRPLPPHPARRRREPPALGVLGHRRSAPLHGRTHPSSVRPQPRSCALLLDRAPLLGAPPSSAMRPPSWPLAPSARCRPPCRRPLSAALPKAFPRLVSLPNPGGEVSLLRSPVCARRLRAARSPGRRLLARSQNKQPQATSFPRGPLSQRGPAPVAAGSGLLGQHQPTPLTCPPGAKFRNPDWSRTEPAARRNHLPSPAHPSSPLPSHTGFIYLEGEVAN